MRHMRVSPYTVPGLVGSIFLLTWTAGNWFPIPSFDWNTKSIEVPAKSETVSLRVKGMKCRHSSMPIEGLLFGREDKLALRGYLRAVIYPAPGAGELQVTYDPKFCNPRKIANAIKYDRYGQESKYRVLLDVKPNRSSVAALLKSLAQAFSDEHEELFWACHAKELEGSADFGQLLATWKELFLDGLSYEQGPDGKGSEVSLQGISLDEKLPFAELGVKMRTLRVEKRSGGWIITAAKWSEFRIE